jgi:hypothetical protein
VVVGCLLRWPIMQFGNSGGKNEYIFIEQSMFRCLVLVVRSSCYREGSLIQIYSRGSVEGPPPLGIGIRARHIVVSLFAR